MDIFDKVDSIDITKPIIKEVDEDGWYKVSPEYAQVMMAMIPDPHENVED